MSDEIEFEGGFFDEAEVNLNEIPDDPFEFGNDYWPVRIVEVGAPKVTANKDKIGMMIKWAVEHPKFDGTMVARQMGNGNWTQLPVPKALRSQIPWDQSGETEKRVLFNLKQLYAALGFGVDEMGGVNAAKLMNRICLAKIKVTQDDQGFWQFRLNAMKPIPEGGVEGLSEFTPSGTSNGGKSPEELLKEELENG